MKKSMYNMQHQGNRIVSIDLLKTFAMFGVVFIHARDGNFISEQISEIFRVSVPIFIVFFAYFLAKSLSNKISLKTYTTVLLKRFTVLFIPYSFFTVLYFFLFNNLSTIDFQDLLTGYWSGYGFSGQYFFIILFQILFIFPVIQKISNWRQIHIYLFYAFSLLFYILMTYQFWDMKIINMISDRLFIYWLPYVVLGILLYQHEGYFKEFRNRRIVIFSLLLIPLEFTLLNHYNITHSPYVVPTVLIASIFLSIYFVISRKDIADYLPNKVKLFSIFVSERTLGIFVLNPLVIFMFKPLYVHYIWVNNIYIDNIFILLFSITVFIISLLMVVILEKTNFKRLVVN